MEFEFNFNTHLSNAKFLIEILYARQMSEHYNTNTQLQ